MDDFILKTDLLDIQDVVKFIIIDMCSVDDFETLYKNRLCSYTRRGNTIHTIGEIKFSELTAENYIWEDICNDNDLEIIGKIVKFPSMKIPIRNAHIYKGSKGTGSHIHYHTYVANYLIKGKKLWYIFPHTDHNKEVIKKDGYVKMAKQRLSVNVWLMRKKRMLEKKIEGLQIIEQYEGEILCLPTNWFHIVLNLEDVMGVAYSW